MEFGQGIRNRVVQGCFVYRYYSLDDNAEGSAAVDVGHRTASVRHLHVRQVNGGGSRTCQ
ncbi:hypothetical protein D3C73_1410210 [compost metagenome]